MIISNVVVCPNCKKELQPENFWVTIKDGCLISVCAFCDVMISKFDKGNNGHQGKPSNDAPTGAFDNGTMPDDTNAFEEGEEYE